MTESPSISEIAALTARLRALSTPGRAVDPAEHAAFLADKDALLARITESDVDTADASSQAEADRAFDALTEQHPLPGEGPGDWVTDGRGRTLWVSEAEMADLADEEPVGRGSDADEAGLTGAEGPPLTSGETRPAEEAARHLARGDRSLDEARAMVRNYQDEASARLGVAVHGWGLDDADLASIEATAGEAPALVPVQRSEPMTEDDRRAELARWHAADASAGEGDGLDRGPM